MASFNRVILLGNITRDIELKHLTSGMAVTEIGLAVNDRRKDHNGQWIEEPTFVDVTLWGRNAEVVAEYLGRGSPVLIEGRLKLDQWEKEGQKRSKLRVVAEKVQLLPSGKRQPPDDYDDGGDEPTEPPPRQQSRSAPPPRSEPPAAGDDIPF
jgi:single-strand DNA-binding protein